MSPLALSLPTTAEHVWTASGPAAEHQLVPATNLDIDRSRVRVLVQLDPAVIVPAILTAVGTPVLRTLAAAYRKSETKAARDAAIEQLVKDERVITACQIALTQEAAEQLAEALSDMALEPMRCDWPECGDYSIGVQGLCRTHGG